MDIREIVMRDVLELVEDRVYEGNERGKDKEGWIEVGMGKKQYKSYREALKSAKIEVEERFFNDCGRQYNMNSTNDNSYVRHGIHTVWSEWNE